MWGNWDSNPGSADSGVLVLNWSRSIKHHAGSWICLHRVLCLPSLHLDVLSTSFAISSYLTLLLWSAAAAAKSLQPCPTLCDPIDGSPAGFPVPGILQVRTLEWVAISSSNAWKWKVKVQSLSRVRLLVTHGLQPTRLLHPWDFPGKSTGVGCHCLLRDQQQKAKKNKIIWSLLLKFSVHSKVWSELPDLPSLAHTDAL